MHDAGVSLVDLDEFPEVLDPEAGEGDGPPLYVAQSYTVWQPSSGYISRATSTS
jgi:hypothetical protein